MFWPITLLGLLIGWLLASIPGALLGGLLGQVLDRRLGLDSWTRLRARLAGKPVLQGRDLLFFLLGRLAKSGGRVSPAHIQAARDEMRRQGLDAAAQVKLYSQDGAPLVSAEPGETVRPVVRPVVMNEADRVTVRQRLERLWSAGIFR